MADSNAHWKTMFVPTDIQTHTSGSCRSASYYEPTRSIVVECVQLKRHACVYIPVYVFGNQASTKTVLRRFLCIVNASLDAVFRSHPAASASHLDQEKRPEGRMDERREVLHATERGFSLAASLWAESVCLGLCALMSTSVCMSLLIYERKRKLPRRNVCSHCLQLLVGVGNIHMEEQGAREDRKRQVSYKWLRR